MLCCCVMLWGQDVLANDDASDDDEVFETTAGDDVDDEDTIEAEARSRLYSPCSRGYQLIVWKSCCLQLTIRFCSLCLLSLFAHTLAGQELALGHALKQQQAAELEELEADNELYD